MDVDPMVRRCEIRSPMQKPYGHKTPSFEAPVSNDSILLVRLHCSLCQAEPPARAPDSRAPGGRVWRGGVGGGCVRAGATPGCLQLRGLLPRHRQGGGYSRVVTCSPQQHKHFKILRSRWGIITFFENYCLPPKTKTYIRKALIWHIGELNRSSGHKSTALFWIFLKYAKGGPLEKKF